jgi:hypothetical protein
MAAGGRRLFDLDEALLRGRIEQRRRARVTAIIRIPYGYYVGHPKECTNIQARMSNFDGEACGSKSAVIQ